jgi:hypothetical protein
LERRRQVERVWRADPGQVGSLNKLASRQVSFAGHRFPAEVISQAVWLYFRFPLSLRMAEEMLVVRCTVVSNRLRMVRRAGAGAIRTRDVNPRNTSRHSPSLLLEQSFSQQHTLFRRDSCFAHQPLVLCQVAPDAGTHRLPAQGQRQQAELFGKALCRWAAYGSGHRLL